MNPLPTSYLNISGVLPHLAVKAEHLPARSETGISAHWLRVISNTAGTATAQLAYT